MQSDETEETIIELEDEEQESEQPEQEESRVALQEPDEEPAQEEEPETQEASSNEEELEIYSEGVQRRIRKLTAKYREEERQRQSAIEYAENVQKRNAEL